MREMNFEKDYLVIIRKGGKFESFRWYSSDKTSEGAIQKLLEDWNNADARKGDGFVGELITEPLVREICAYKEYVRPYQIIIDRAKEIQESSEEAIEKLDHALYELNQIRLWRQEEV
jgi:hypothetical protein